MFTMTSLETLADASLGDSLDSLYNAAYRLDMPCNAWNGLSPRRAWIGSLVIRVQKRMNC